LTDHDRDILFNGDTYPADAGFARTAIRSDAGFAVDSLEMVGVFAEGGLVEDECKPACSTAPQDGLRIPHLLPFDSVPSELTETNDQPHLTAQPGCCL
jgi:hypothetical protein